MTCTHDDADKAPCLICERDAEIARLRALLNEAANALGPGHEGLCGAICALLGKEKTI